MRRFFYLLLLTATISANAACNAKSGDEKPAGATEEKKEETPKEEKKVDIGQELHNANYGDPQKLMNARGLAIKNMYETKGRLEGENVSESDEVKEKAIAEKAIKNWMERVK